MRRLIAGSLRARAGAGVGLVVLGVGMLTSATGASAPGTSDPTQLFKGPYVSTSVTKGGAPHPLFAGTEIRVQFEDGDPDDVVQWEAKCNDLGAPVDITDERFLTGLISGTEIGCPTTLARQDKWLNRLFGSDPRWRAHGGGTLKLKVGWRVLKLRRSVQP